MAGVVGGGWQLLVRRDDLGSTRLEPVPVPPLEAGQALLQVDRFGLTANNITYAALGDSFRYWEFFPTPLPWGLCPVWGFADVIASEVDGVEVGQRYYGYYPSASHLVVTPDRFDSRGFRDGAAHRRALPSPYNTYALTTTDQAYDPDREDLLVLYRPLFWTSYMFADWVIDNAGMGARRVVLSSASSKTAYGAAFSLRQIQQQRGGSPLEVVGLTSARNREFTAGLGLYDQVLTYADLSPLDDGTPTLYADVLGDVELSRRVRESCGDALRHGMVLGLTSQEADVAGRLEDAGGDEMFFAPVQMRKRVGDWGLEQVDRTFATAWRSFGDRLPEWVEVVTSPAPEQVEEVWRQVQSGATDPRTGHLLRCAAGG